MVANRARVELFRTGWHREFIDNEIIEIVSVGGKVEINVGDKLKCNNILRLTKNSMQDTISLLKNSYISATPPFCKSAKLFVSA